MIARKYHASSARFVLCAILLAQLIPVQAGAPIFGGSVSSAYQFESYDEREGLDAEVFTLDASAYVAGERWSSGVYLPWQSGDAAATVNFSAVQLLATCRKIAATDLATVLVLAARNDRFREIIAQCRRLRSRDFFAQDKVEGLNDISVDVAYSLRTGELVEQVFNVAAVLTGDNGDADKGLGSGTVDAALDLGYAWYFSRITLSANSGYNFVLGGRLADIYDDYGYLSVDAEYDFQNGLAVSLGGSWTESSLPGADDSRSASLEARWKFADYWRLKAGYTTYMNLDGYPDYEYSMGLSVSY